MNPLPVIAIFDIGKTNKKLFLFDESYRIVFEKSAQFAETLDEDGFPCENLERLEQFVFDSLKEIFSMQQFEIVAVNFSAYGASFVYVDKNGKPLNCFVQLSEAIYSFFDGAILCHSWKSGIIQSSNGFPGFGQPEFRSPALPHEI